MIDCNDIDLVRFIEEKEINGEIAKHINCCPVCGENVEELKALIKTMTSYYEIEFDLQQSTLKNENPDPLPDHLRRAIRLKRATTETRKAIEGLIGKSVKSKQWVEDIIRQTLNSASPYASPAARDDLTQTKDEAGDNINDDNDEKDPH